MNWLDSAIAAISPTAGLRRAQARAAIQAMRSYEAARRGRRTDGWTASGGSANAEIAPGLRTLRNRCRSIIRDNEYASRALDAMVAHTVGTGIVARATDQARWDAWTQYCDADGQLDFNGLVELAHRCRREVGEVLVRFYPRDPEKYEIPLQIQVIEPDLLDESRIGPMENGNFAVLGVEYDINTFQRVAYWLYDHHPEEVAGWRMRTLISKRVPATEVLHYYRKRRPTQARGVSEFATALLRIRDFADYQLAQLVLKKMQSCFVAFVRSEDDSASLGTVDATQSPRQEKLSPGMIKYLRNSEQVTFGAPSVGGDDTSYTSAQLHAIAAGCGSTYEDMTGDYSQFTFSSARASKLAYRALIEQEQWLALVPMLLNPIAERVQRTAWMAGKARGRPKPFGWTMPRLQLVDPLKEALGIKELIRGGLMSLPEAIRELGYDPEEVAREGGDYKKILAQHGIVVDTDAAVSEGLTKSGIAPQLSQD
ncbi:MAG: phage portal protein [Sinobacteraceae bacterium]|nr:phage portal protein [Nevskiaceae bacterium]